MVNHQSSKLANLGFQYLDTMSRYRDPQLQVTGNYLALFNSGTNEYQCFKIYPFQHVDRHYTSVCRRHILTFKNGPALKELNYL